MMDSTKYHLTELRMSKSKLKHNLERFCSYLKPSTQLMLMIKADGYGHGSIPLAKTLEAEQRVGYFSVAYADEGIKLREAGIEKPILILNPSPNAFASLVENCLEPEIHNFTLLDQFIQHLESNRNEGAPYPVHLKFNTGMNRMGFNADQIAELRDRMSAQNVIQVRSIMTHLSSAHMESEDEFTLRQLSAFESIIEETKEIQNEQTFFHCLNTSGIYRFSSHQYDLVRLGIGYYGNSPVEELNKELQSAAQLISSVSQVRRVKKGDSISYSRSGRADRDKNIAVLSLGYADGFNRKLGNGQWEVEIGGKFYPTIGNICMGLSMIDLGDDEVSIGEEVIIFGGEKSIYDYAKALDTITYEVMCSIGSRVNRTIV